MTNIERVRKAYHINDQTLSKVIDLMDEARAAIEEGKEYSSSTFERKMRKIVVAPVGDPEYDHHMVIDIAEAFGRDGRWEEVYPTLYRDDVTQKASIENYYEEKLGDCLK